MSIKPILSVGIDVGTTSTHLTINRLFLSNISRAAEPERVVVSHCEKFYESPIKLTPLCSDGSIDADAIFSFLDEQYQLAHVKPADIVSGAIIVTGETAKIRNAEVVAERVSSLAGQFVVASAGPNFESVLAGRGSGAAEYSKTHHKVVCNVDIGGGTTNVAIFKGGFVKSTAAIALGGRLLCLTDELQVLQLTESASIAVESEGLSIRVGETISNQSAMRIAEYAARIIVDMLTSDDYAHPLLVTQSLRIDEHIDEFWFSGGVAGVMSADFRVQSDTEYGDLGIFLARALVDELNTRGIKFHVPGDAIRATVLGAGVHSLQLSGSTVQVSESILPLRDIPVLRLPTLSSVGANLPPRLDDFIQAVSTALDAIDLEWSATCVALSAPWVPRSTYSSLRTWAALIADTFRHLQAKHPLVIICLADIAGALGQMLRSELADVPVVCLDGINDEALGDFMDIGSPVLGGRAVPVVVKSLVFDAVTRPPVCVQVDDARREHDR
ncbi:MAG: ethanolamine ammonia-lyase reactivating factor EutA [Cyanobacteria bacterium SZAS-4]|nr:ethanolamine ammonia-lyase reactivating factor EutA [Cyanobacteria bacterium SZAS-4]